ncbi:uncharacterized protein [Fopius arisanus]|uniref:Reverse transcriptase domain-containing protein n=1 Tax=Fopius arisanus TaxID=64838 RepID=A0A9R1TIE6_9HYME|nr:PREDICTED: uncharacterized protein LOC105270352 [Fopius arisanus]
MEEAKRRLYEPMESDPRGSRRDHFRARYAEHRHHDSAHRDFDYRNPHSRYDYPEPQNTAELIRKWRVTFDWVENVLNFLERTEELRESSHISYRTLLENVPVMWVGEAIFWYRNNKRLWYSWQDFVHDLNAHFLLRNHLLRLEREMNDRIQKEGERIRVYVTEALTLMRRHDRYSEEEKLERLYFNLRWEYKNHIRKIYCRTINDLIALGSDYESEVLELDRDARQEVKISGKADKNKQKKDDSKKKSNSATEVAAITAEKYDRPQHCWKCRQKGRQTRNCENPRPNAAPVQQCRNGPVPIPMNQVNQQLMNVPLSYTGTSNQPLLLTDNRVYMNIIIDGVNYLGLMDSGAVKTYISPSTYKQILTNNPELKLQKTGHTVRVADGRMTPISGKLEIIVNFQPVTTLCTFYVMEELSAPIIVGVDIMRKMGFSMRFEPQDDLSEDEEIGTIGYITEADQIEEPIDEEPAERRVKQNLENLIHFIGQRFGLAEISDEWGEDLEPRTPERGYEEAIAEIMTELEKLKDIKGPTNLIKYTIRLKENTEPIKFRYASKNPAILKIMQEEVDRMEAEGIIEDSDSPWNSPVVIVKIKNNKNRFCVDYRKVNEVAVKDAYRLPHINTMLDKFHNAQYISVINLKNGYWQVPMDEASKPITAFTVPGRGLQQFKVMPFGFTSAPATFQRLLDRVIKPELENKVGAYLDDIYVVGSSLDESVPNQKIVFGWLGDAKLQINIEKSEFLQTATRYLGHIVGRNGIRPDPEKVEAITQISEPEMSEN